MRTRSFLSLAVALVVGGCGLSYEGEVAPPTAHIDVFFDAASIEQDYTTMGTLDARANQPLVWLESDMATAGMKHGADAIVIDGMSPADAQSVATDRVEGAGRPRYVQDPATGGVKNVGGAEHHGRLTTPPSVRVRLLKYDR